MYLKAADKYLKNDFHKITLYHNAHSWRIMVLKEIWNFYNTDKLQTTIQDMLWFRMDCVIHNEDKTVATPYKFYIKGFILHLIM